MKETTPVTSVEDDSNLLKYLQPTELSGMCVCVVITSL